MDQFIPEPFENIDNHLAVDGFDIVELSEKEGTPLLVTSGKRIAENYRRIWKAFSSRYGKVEIKYALKANPNPSVVKTLTDLGCGADVSSPFEIMLAEKLRLKPERILYSPNNSSREDLLAGSRKNVTVNFDDLGQMKLIEDELPERISFRINVDIQRGEFPGTTTSGPGAKFGISVESALEGYISARELGVRKFGIHVMTGSNILDPAHFGNVASRILQSAEYISGNSGITFDFIDIGGGFGVPYRPGESALDVELAAENVAREMKGYVSHGKIGKPSLFLEPGRYLVADSSVMVGKVTGVKKAGKTFVGTDIGMNIFLRPALYGAYHNVIVANDLIRPVSGKKDIVGQICENTDCLARDRSFPYAVPDDTVAVFNSGAYINSMGSMYNGRGRPKEIMVSESGYSITRNRDTFQDFISNYTFE
ncbi:MAG: diaminopimelate decarboxylase [Thermoplasmataceae archaeon]